MTYVSDYVLPGGKVYHSKNRPRRMSNTAKYGFLIIVIFCLGYFMWPSSATPVTDANDASKLSESASSVPAGTDAATAKSTKVVPVATGGTIVQTPNTEATAATSGTTPESIVDSSKQPEKKASDTPQQETSKKIEKSAKIVTTTSKTAAGIQSPKDFVASLISINKVVMFSKDPCSTCEDERSVLKKNSIAFWEQKIDVSTDDGKNLAAYLMTTYKKSDDDMLIILNNNSWVGNAQEFDTLVKENKLLTEINKTQKTIVPENKKTA